MTGQHIEDILDREGIYVSTTVGVSMYPMLRNRKDTIIVTSCKERLKKYDVPLYRRGEEYVLHRILEVREDSYVIRGDNCIQKEYGIKQEQIIGVLTGFYRGEKQVDMNSFTYKCYSRIWPALYPMRLCYWRAKQMAKKVFPEKLWMKVKAIFRKV